MKIWQITGTAWRVTRQSLPVVAAILILQVVLGLLGLPLLNQGGAPTTGQTALAVILGLTNFLLWPLIQGGVLALGNDKLAGQPAAITSPIGAFLAGGKAFYLRMLGFGVLWGCLTVLLVIVGAALFTLATVAGAKTPALGVLIVLAMLAPLSIGAYVLIVLTSASPVAIVVEKLKLFAGIRRGLAIGRSIFWKLIVVSLTVTLTLLPGIGLAMLLAYLQGDPATLSLGWRIVNLVVQSALNAVSIFLFSAAFVQVYRTRIAQPAAS